MASLSPQRIVAGIALCSTLLATRGTVVADGAAAHWTFDESKGMVVHDSAGSHDGAIQGAPSFVPGVAGNALKLSRITNDCVPVGQVFDGSGDFSVSLWMKLAPGAAPDNYPIGYHYAGIVNGWFVFTGSTGGCYGQADHPGFYTANTCGGEVNAGLNVNDGAWHHVVCTYSPGGTKHIVVDGGAAEASGSANTINVHPSAKLVLGGLIFGGSPVSGFDGWLDDVQIYTRVLSCAEIEYLFLHPGQEASLVSDLNGDGAVTAADLAILLGAWGPCGAGPCAADLDCSGGVDAADLAVLLGAWTD